jgi:hypothetical protein
MNNHNRAHPTHGYPYPYQPGGIEPCLFVYFVMSVIVGDSEMRFSGFSANFITKGDEWIEDSKEMSMAYSFLTITLNE